MLVLLRTGMYEVSGDMAYLPSVMMVGSRYSSNMTVITATI
jgi:hypothetical protein